MNKDKVTWQAVYQDDSVLTQYGQDDVVNKYSDIDRERLARFELLREGKVFYSLFLHKGQRLIFRRRNLITMQARDINDQAKKVVYLVGYQVTLGGLNYIILNYIYEDGRVELDNSRSNLELYDNET